MIVAPEPAPWLDAVGDGPVFAPWAMRSPARAPLPAKVRAFVDRRRLDGADRVPGWWLAEAALRAWAGDRTERHLRARFAAREATDRFAARLVRKARPTEVVAPSCAAWRTFAAAREVGARCILVEDLPDVRGLHDDLDRAAAAHPQCAFLRNYRASDRVIVRQEVERALADEIRVRGRFAAARIADRPTRALALPPPPPLARRTGGDRPRILLAGLAAARHGSVEALAMLDRMPGIELAVRAGDGAEPRALIDHPRVVSADEPVDLVIAPAWVECYPADVVAAAAAGIPVVATERAAGFVDATLIAAGDVDALSEAVERLI